jgi:hypothetical protein
VRGRRRGRAVYLRRRLALLALVLLAAAAIVVALVSALGGPDRRLTLAHAYVTAWERGDYAAMRRLLAPAARRSVTLKQFAGAHRAALATATATAPPRPAGAPQLDGDVVTVPLRVPTRAFGVVRAVERLAIAGDDGIAWRPYLAFPGVRRGERLSAVTTLPPRATLLAADGGVLAQGDARTPDPALADVADETVGQLGRPDPERARELRALGVPADAETGVTGLERALDDRLIGTPGGRLLAGQRVLAQRAPRAAAPVRTTIVPAVVRAAADALAGRDGGAVAIDPRSGALLGYAGVAFSALEPPGSTFKIITLVAALEAHATSEDAQFPEQTEALLDGAPLQNDDGELCGGSLIESFAKSCNSVFAPLGARVGADRLAATARRFGFDSPPDIPGVPASTVPGSDEGDDALTVGSTAIGQGKVLADALQMASVAATIARGGVRPRLTLDAAPPRTAAAMRPRRATSAAVARVAQEAMRAVVEEGTGSAAAIDGVPVAGKTGTAEIGVSCTPELADAGACDLSDTSDTDAWFAGYAPADPHAPARAAVGVLLLRAGAGGATAAPVAHTLLLAALDATAARGGA